jgi:TRAP-type mannitol/chloroaromatic compound transport system permease small subunit
LLRARCASKGQAIFDIIAVLALASTSIVVAYGAWPVLARAIKYGSAANTTLETPLWIPQSLWMMGWIWFAASALIMAAASLLAFFSGRFERVNSIVGVGGER